MVDTTVTNAAARGISADFFIERERHSVSATV